MPVKNVIDFHIFLGEDRDEYIANSLSGTLRTDSQPMGLKDLLGSTPLGDIYRAGVRPGAQETAFVGGLRDLKERAPGRGKLQEIGRSLFDALPGGVQDLFQRVWAGVESDRDKLLRVRLHFNQDVLALLPWEFMWVGDTF